jgi:uncharacterized low-complexity protein
MKRYFTAAALTAALTLSAAALEAPANHMVDAAWLKAHMGDKVKGVW